MCRRTVAPAASGLLRPLHCQLPALLARKAVIDGLLPAAVVVVEAAAGDLPDPLFLEERAALSRSIPRRLEEFAVGRTCARRALGALGEPSQPILPGAHREPRWPSGFVGSITHCPGYCAAAVARADEIAAIGIDAEVNEPLPPGVLDQVALPAELAWLRARDGHGGCRDRLLFSAKECVFKAWFPLTDRWLGFENACISFSHDTGTFEAQLLIDGPRIGGVRVRSFTGRFRVGDGLVLTAIATPAA